MDKQTNLKRKTLLSLWKEGKFTGLGLLTFNKTGYPFLTMLNNNKAQNLYFSKAAAEKIEEQGFIKGTNLIENGFLKEAEIVQTENNNGEIRFKISIPKLESKYSSTASLESLFGTNNKETEFDIDLFMKEFKSAADNAVTATEQTA